MNLENYYEITKPPPFFTIVLTLLSHIFFKNSFSKRNEIQPFIIIKIRMITKEKFEKINITLPFPFYFTIK